MFHRATEKTHIRLAGDVLLLGMLNTDPIVRVKDSSFIPSVHISKQWKPNAVGGMPAWNRVLPLRTMQMEARYVPIALARYVPTGWQYKIVS